MQLFEQLKAKRNVPVDDAFAVLFAGKHKTSEISGVPPVSFTSKGGVLEDYRIYGNTIQDGRPSPEASVDVVGCGARTWNLLNVDTSVTGYNISANGEIVENANYVLSDYIPVQSGSYILSLTNGYKGTGTTANRAILYDIQKQNAVLILDYSDTRPVNVIKTLNVRFDGFIRVSHRITDTNVMLNTGSTEKPYEPYGYKLPPTVNGTEYPIYLGSCQTTRRIRKLVLTGKEAGWNRSGAAGRSIFYLDTITPDYLRSDDITLLCSHYKAIAGVSEAKSVGEGETSLYKTVSENQRLYFGDNNYSVVDDFKTYLAQQYANGTPVTVWYVLATPATGIVNEPLMKIGDYADTISMAQAGVTIPTVAGANTLTIDTTVQPSSVTIRGRIRPTL